MPKMPKMFVTSSATAATSNPTDVAIWTLIHHGLWWVGGGSLRGGFTGKIQGISS